MDQQQTSTQIYLVLSFMWQDSLHEEWTLKDMVKPTCFDIMLDTESRLWKSELTSGEAKGR